jgi:hypothetical protein
MLAVVEELDVGLADGLPQAVGLRRFTLGPAPRLLLRLRCLPGDGAELGPLGTFLHLAEPMELGEVLLVLRSVPHDSMNFAWASFMAPPPTTPTAVATMSRTLRNRCSASRAGRGSNRGRGPDGRPTGKPDRPRHSCMSQ